jgi:hypothetical protein
VAPTHRGGGRCAPRPLGQMGARTCEARRSSVCTARWRCSRIRDRRRAGFCAGSTCPGRRGLAACSPLARRLQIGFASKVQTCATGDGPGGWIVSSRGVGCPYVRRLRGRPWGRGRRLPAHASMSARRQIGPVASRATGSGKSGRWLQRQALLRATPCIFAISVSPTSSSATDADVNKTCRRQLQVMVAYVYRFPSMRMGG